MLYSRRFLITALGAAPLAAHVTAHAQPAACVPSLAALSQRMGKAWLCGADPELADRAQAVLASSQAGFEQQLAQHLQRASGPEQAGSLRALARRYGDYKTLLAATPSADGHRQLLSTANEVLTLTQLASSPRDATPWQAHLAAHQRLLSQRVALLGLASFAGPAADAARRERQAGIYEFEAGLQTLKAAPGTGTLQRDRLALAQAAWEPLKSGISTGRTLQVFIASEQLLTVMDAVTEHCTRLAA